MPVPILDAAQTDFGLPYTFGAGIGRGGSGSCDCSGYVAAEFGKVGVSLPAFTDAIAAQTTLVGTDLSSAQPGDLLLYSYSDPSQPGTRFPHIAIYAGNGQTYACQYPNGSGVYPVLSLPFEVHRVGGVNGASGGLPLPLPSLGAPLAWVQSNPLVAAAIAAAILLLSR